jgi:hypothetical protein
MWRPPRIISDPFDDPYYMNRRYNSYQSLPMIVNPQPLRYQRRFQDVYANPIIEPPPTPFIDDGPFVYERAYTPSLIEEPPYAYYESCETPPIRRRVRDTRTNDKKVHLPQHAKKLVNRFLSNLEHAHEHQVRFI